MSEVLPMGVDPRIYMRIHVRTSLLLELSLVRLFTPLRTLAAHVSPLPAAIADRLLRPRARACKVARAVWPRNRRKQLQHRSAS